MQTFKQFISEGSKFSLEKFKKDCAFILNELAGTKSKYVMYHGKKNFPDDFSILPWRERSAPRDTPQVAHDYVNFAMQDRFGAPVRNWMFISGDTSAAQIYAGFNAPICVVFPIGKFEWIQGQDDNLRDMTGWANRIAAEIATSDAGGTLSTDVRQKIAAQHMAQKMKHMKFRHNTDLVSCLKSDNEIMMKCDKFYLFNVRGETWENIVEPFLKAL